MGSNWRETWGQENIIKICKALQFFVLFLCFFDCLICIPNCKNNMNKNQSLKYGLKKKKDMEKAKPAW